MAEPKKKISSTRSGNRRSHLALKPRMASKCSHCGAMVSSHNVCKNCGYYKGNKVLEVK